MGYIMKIKQILLFKALLFSGLANAGWVDVILDKVSYFTAVELPHGIDGFADDYTCEVSPLAD